MTRIYIYSRFNRLWHWGQALLVILLAWTGLEIHFSPFGLLGFEHAVVWHRYLAWAFLILVACAIFWHVTTGQWRQYVPTSKFLLAMLHFYLLGIFRDAPHPVHKTQLSKLNPLQRLTYLGLKILVIPVLATSGLLYYYYNEWGRIGLQDLKLAPVALVHTFAAYVLMAFMFVHVYLTTTGRTPLANIKAMITGWEVADEEGSSAKAAPPATNGN